jgi:hypothetical protein
VLTFLFILYDNASPGHFHEHCASVIGVRIGTRWMDSMQYQFARPADFVGSVVQLKSVLWCAHCEKVLFSMPRRLPCQGLTIYVTSKLSLGTHKNNLNFLSTQ